MSYLWAILDAQWNYLEAQAWSMFEEENSAGPLEWQVRLCHGWHGERR